MSMSDQHTTRTGPGATSRADAEASRPAPATPIGSEALADDTTTGTSTAAPAGPGEDRDSGDRDAVDGVGATSGSPIGAVADAASEAARAAAAKIREAAENADLDQFADEAKRVTGEWTEKVKEEYRRRPGVVIGAAVAGVVVLGAIARAIGRRR
jgi:hypothetical protein